MNRRLTNIVVLATVVLLVATGLIAWVLPESRATVLYDLHRIAGVGLLVALPWKELVARASFVRRERLGTLKTTMPGLLASAALVATLALGIAWTLGLVSFDRPIPYSAMNLHVFAGIALLPLTAWHAAQRWELPRTRDLTGRRAAIRLGALGAVAIVGGLVAGAFPAGRRVTGSKHAGSFTGNAFPTTIWAFDQVPNIDPAAWRLEVVGAPDRRTLSLADLADLPSREVDAVIDCTGGWWSEQRWRGVAVRDVLGSRGIADARSLTMTSVTGHSWSFTAQDLEGALLATHVGGEPLSAGHGGPARLVVPGRRGFQWIKWVGRISVEV